MGLALNHWMEKLNVSSSTQKRGVYGHNQQWTNEVWIILLYAVRGKGTAIEASDMSKVNGTLNGAR